MPSLKITGFDCDTRGGPPGGVLSTAKLNVCEDPDPRQIDGIPCPPGGYEYHVPQVLSRHTEVGERPGN